MNQPEIVRLRAARTTDRRFTVGTVGDERAGFAVHQAAEANHFLDARPPGGLEHAGVFGAQRHDGACGGRVYFTNDHDVGQPGHVVVSNCAAE
jgi:hypothetical protein